MLSKYKVLITLFVIIFINLICLASLNSQVNFAYLKVDKIVLGKQDLLTLRLVIKTPNFNYINIKAITKYFFLTEPEKYYIDEHTKFFEVEYKLKPLTIGNIEIKGIEITYDNGIIEKIEPITIKIVPGSVYNHDHENTQLYENTENDKEIYIKIITNKDTYYKGEAIILNIILYSIYPIEREYEYEGKKPSFQKQFWEPGHDDLILLQYDVVKEKINGTMYKKKIIDRRILYSKGVGEYTFGPYKLKVRFGTGQIYKTQYSITSDKKTIKIKSLPNNNVPNNNVPNNFKNSLGEFNIKSKITGYSSMDENNIPIFSDDTFISLIININAYTNPDIINEPDISKIIKNFKIISQDSTSKEEPTDKGYMVSKTFEYLLQPKIAGIIELAPIDYSFFNTKTEKYQVINTSPIKIKVLERAITNYNTNYNDDDTKLIISKLNPIIKSEKLLNRHAYYLFSPIKNIIIIYLIFIALLIPISIIIYKYRKKLLKQTGYVTKSQAYKNAKSNLQSLENLLNKNEAEFFYKKLNKILLTYITDVFQISKGNTKYKDIVKIMEHRNIDKNIINSFNKLYNKFMHIAFSNDFDISKLGAEKDLNDTLNIISLLENKLKLT